MAKDKQNDAKKDKKKMFSLRENDLFCADGILLRGERSAVLYGCGRILFYGRERICFSMGRRAVSLIGEDLCCTVFSPSGVTVEGKIKGVYYCDANCSECCHWQVRKGEDV